MSNKSKLVFAKPGTGGGGVTSVFGRMGAVVAALADYAASLISNDSSVIGATVKDALNSLATAISAAAVTNSDASFTTVVANEFTSVKLPVPYAAGVTLDTALHNDFEIAPLTGNIAITLSNFTDNRSGSFIVEQGGAGTFLVTLVVAGRTFKADDGADLVAGTGLGTQTLYTYNGYTINGVPYVGFTKSVQATV